jgi:hypothetical protein
LRVVLREAAKAPYRTPGRIRLGAMERGADRRPAKRHERGNRARQSHPPRPTRLPRTLTGLERAGRRKTKLERDTDLTDAEQDGADFEDDRQDQDRDRRPGQCRQPDDDVGERDLEAASTAYEKLGDELAGRRDVAALALPVVDGLVGGLREVAELAEAAATTLERYR